MLNKTDLLDFIKLKSKKFIKQSVALEVFAREGDWHTKDIYNQVKYLEAWEIDPKFISKLKKNLPNSTIHNVDSYQKIKDKASI